MSRPAGEAQLLSGSAVSSQQDVHSPLNKHNQYHKQVVRTAACDVTESTEIYFKSLCICIVDTSSPLGVAYWCIGNNNTSADSCNSGYTLTSVEPERFSTELKTHLRLC